MLNHRMFALETQFDAVVHFFCEMDIDMIDAVLGRIPKLQSMKKQKFISQLEKVFQNFKSAGDTCLIKLPGNCNNCYVGKAGYVFVGNKSKNYINILFDLNQGIITDMFECAFLKPKENSLILNNQIPLENW